MIRPGITCFTKVHNPESRESRAAQPKVMYPKYFCLNFSQHMQVGRIQ